MLTNVLRYPGGKSRAVKIIARLLPYPFTEFREPFVGGGSVFFYVKQSIKSIEKSWINDINEDLQLFWLNAKVHNKELVSTIEQYRSMFSSGRELFYYLKDTSRSFTDLERAARFFILNRSSFSGTTEAGGYSDAAFHNRLTPSSIKRVASLSSILEHTLITHGDYEECLSKPGDNVFIFLDPPYYSAKKSKLYGKNGCNHRAFDYERLASSLAECRHKWLLTLDNCEYVKSLFDFAFINEWDLQYGMNNVKKQNSAKGKELFVSNYDLSHSLSQQLTISGLTDY